MQTPTEELVRWGTYLARLFRRPRTFKVRPGAGKIQQDHECARRRRFQERHGTAIGGEAIWEHL